jgi:Na+-translocating ferredoxin:NAD+ oxidoreductase RnfC subunit
VLALRSLGEEVVGVPAATDMIKLLVEGHEAVCRTARALLAPADAAAARACATASCIAAARCTETVPRAPV